jgi:hypothetical protein
MTIDEVRAEVVNQALEIGVILPESDADNALLAGGGITPEDIKRVTVTLGAFGVNIAFEV